MNGTAQEMLADCILNQLRGWYADKNCNEYRTIEKYRDNCKSSFIFCYGSSQWGTAFALVTFTDAVIKTIQKAMMKQDEPQLNKLLTKIQKFAVFCAVQQDEGGSYVWKIDNEILSEEWL